MPIIPKIAQKEEKENVTHTTINQLIKAKDSAYWERNQLVLFLCKLFPSHLALHDPADKAWEYDWRTIVCVHTPAGQAAWHIHKDERYQFEHAGLKLELNDWDGHTTEEKYKKLREYDWKAWKEQQFPLREVKNSWKD